MAEGEGRACAKVAVGEFLVVAYIGAADTGGFDGNLELVFLGSRDMASVLRVMLVLYVTVGLSIMK